MQQGEIYLVRFPFTDLTSTKLRPALLISNDSFNKFENCMFIGVFGNKGNPCYSLPLENTSLSEGKLNKTSFIRFQNTFSLHKSLIVQKVASLKPEELKKISEKLSSFTCVN